MKPDRASVRNVSQLLIIIVLISIIQFLFLIFYSHYVIVPSIENRKVILLETMPFPIAINHSQAIERILEEYG